MDNAQDSDLVHWLDDGKKYLRLNHLYQSVSKMCQIIILSTIHLKEKMLTVVIWHIFWRWDQIEELSEIMPPLSNFHYLKSVLCLSFFNNRLYRCTRYLGKHFLWEVCDWLCANSLLWCHRKVNSDRLMMTYDPIIWVEYYNKCARKATYLQWFYWLFPCCLMCHDKKQFSMKFWRTRAPHFMHGVSRTFFVKYKGWIMMVQLF